MSEIDFNYAVWPANSTVTLCNVPWNSDYRDIVQFDSPAQLDKYLQETSGPTVHTNNVSYHRVGTPIRLDIPFNSAYRYNYLRVENGAQGIEGDTKRAFYYFIADVRHLSPNTTEFILLLDVWQTFGFDIDFGMCYVERGHIGVANSAAFLDFGRGYLTAPEGLDVGGEYVIDRIHSRQIASARGDLGEKLYSILVLSTVSIDEDPGTVEAPNLKSATGSGLENLPNGVEAYMFESLHHFHDFMYAYADKPWITQGIISITAIPVKGAERYGMTTTAKRVANATIHQVNNGSLKTVSSSMATDWRTDTLARMGDGRYRNLHKLMTYPYTVVELTSHTGTPVVIKPESWQDANMTINEVPHFAQPGPRIMFYPHRYNAGREPARTDNYGVVHDGGEFMDMATGIFNFPTFSIVNNSYISFMASNVNNIAYQNQSADWSQQKALRGSQVSFDQATSGMNTSESLTNIGIGATNQQTTLANQTAGFQGLQSAVNGVVNARNPAGALMSGVNAAAGYAITTNQNNQGAAIRNQAARSSNNATVGNQGFVRDTNKAYADFAAKGDYANAIAGVQAKVQDAKMLQPTTSGQVGGDAFMLANYGWGYDLKVKVMQPAAMAMVGEFMLRYGYAISRFIRMPKNLHVMQRFTYWQLKETYITGSDCPETFKQSIRGIFEKGVTVWRNPREMGNIDIADNQPIRELYY